MFPFDLNKSLSSGIGVWVNSSVQVIVDASSVLPSGLGQVQFRALPWQNDLMVAQERQTAMRDEIIVTIGSRLLDGFESYSGKNGISDGGAIEATAKLGFEPNPSLEDLDLTAQVGITLRRGDIESRIFTGYVLQAGYNGKVYEIHAKDPSVILNEQRILPAFGKGFHPLELVALILQGASDIPADILWQNIEGNHNQGKPLGSLVYFAPMPFLPNPKAPLPLLNATIVSTSGPECAALLDDRNYLDPSQCVKLPEARAMARFDLKAQDFVNGIAEGRAEVQTFCSAISAALDITSSFDGSQIPDGLLDFDRARLGIAIPEPFIGIIVDGPMENLRFWAHGYYPETRSAPVDIEGHAETVSLVAAVTKLRGTGHQKRARQIERALRSLHSAKHSNTLLDKANHLSCAVENLVSGAKSQGGPSLEEIERMSRAATAAIDVGAEAVEMESRVLHCLKSLRADSLKMKWERHCAEVGITVTSEEREALAKARKARNDFVHGKPAEITKADAQTAYRLVLRVVTRTIWRWASSQP